MDGSNKNSKLLLILMLMYNMKTMSHLTVLRTFVLGNLLCVFFNVRALQGGLD